MLSRYEKIKIETVARRNCTIRVLNIRWPEE
jgi:hypothetical protein